MQVIQRCNAKMKNDITAKSFKSHEFWMKYSQSVTEN